MTTVELRARLCGGYAVVVLRGELDIADAGSVAGAVAALAADGQPLIIDLEALDFIDCHATGALLKVRKTARQAGGDVLLAGPHGPVLLLLTVLGVPGVHASVADAAHAARRAARRRAWRIARSGKAALSGTQARRHAVPGSRAGGWAGSPRWLWARSGLRG
ncbi:MAG TPA: STAS domain-containing protein [Trebonia sp.]